MLFYPIGSTPACRIAARCLEAAGIPMTDHPCPEVTHLLMDVPGFRDGGPDDVLATLPDNVTLVSGNIPEPYSAHAHLDLLKEESYLWENAAITAECAIKMAPPAVRHTRILVIGWGRIGKHLSHLLRSAGADVTVLSRSEAHRAEAASFGLNTTFAGDYRVIYNTAPEVVLPEGYRSSAIQIDLASRRGLVGPDVVWARGLPGIHAPESSGQLIADTILRHLKEEGS